jgi:hypothetical protein
LSAVVLVLVWLFNTTDWQLSAFSLFQGLVVACYLGAFAPFLIAFALELRGILQE